MKLQSCELVVLWYSFYLFWGQQGERKRETIAPKFFSLMGPDSDVLCAHGKAVDYPRELYCQPYGIVLSCDKRKGNETRKVSILSLCNSVYLWSTQT